jgi:alkanesulfonate monooxygenase SsuD/methylene tetrahydromethanopterin reductase-like flavin-dependent oxidoreductase (luciferase family)
MSDTRGEGTSVFNTGLPVSDDREAARRMARPYVARALGYGVSAQVPGWSLITRKALAGTPEECVERLRSVVDHGFEDVALIPMGDVESNIRLLARRVPPTLRAAAPVTGGT